MIDAESFMAQTASAHLTLFPTITKETLTPINPTKTFSDNTHLQGYIHAPHRKWNVVCNIEKVFVTGDNSKAPADDGCTKRQHN